MLRGADLECPARILGLPVLLALQKAARRPNKNMGDADNDADRDRAECCSDLNKRVAATPPPVVSSSNLSITVAQ